MAATPESILSLLLAPLNPLAKQGVGRRVDAMIRELAFMDKKGDDNLGFIRERRWSDERLRVLFILNSVYQLVLGPQEAACHTTPQVLGGSVPIVHGTFVVDKSFRGRTSSAVSEFFAICAAAGFREQLLTLTTCRDIIYWVARYEREEGNDGTSGGRKKKR